MQCKTCKTVRRYWFGLMHRPPYCSEFRLLVAVHPSPVFKSVHVCIYLRFHLEGAEKEKKNWAAWGDFMAGAPCRVLEVCHRVLGSDRNRWADLLQSEGLMWNQTEVSVCRKEAEKNGYLIGLFEFMWCSSPPLAVLFSAMAHLKTAAQLLEWGIVTLCTFWILLQVFTSHKKGEINEQFATGLCQSNVRSLLAETRGNPSSWNGFIKSKYISICAFSLQALSQSSERRSFEWRCFYFRDKNNRLVWKILAACWCCSDSTKVKNEMSAKLAGEFQCLLQIWHHPSAIVLKDAHSTVSIKPYSWSLATISFLFTFAALLHANTDIRGSLCLIWKCN